MFYLLIRTRLRGLWNAAARSAAGNRLVAAGLTLVGAALFALVYVGFRRFLGLAQGPRALEGLVRETFYFLFLFLLAGSVPFVASTLLHSSDYLLLLAAPVRPPAVIAAKLLDAAVTNSLQFTVIGLPALVAGAAEVHLAPHWWPAAGALVLLFTLLPALLTALTLLLALRAFGARRVRSAIATVNLLMAAVVCLTIVGQVNRLPIRRDWAPYASASRPYTPGYRRMPLPPADSPSPGASVGPAAWFADCLLELAHDRAAAGLSRLGLLASGVGALFAACVTLGAAMLRASLLGDEEGEAGGGSRYRSARARRRVGWTGPVGALVWKDLRYVARDSVLLGQLGMPLILFFVPYALALQDTLRSVATAQELYFVSVGMTGFIVFMQTSILSLSSIGLEGRSFWIVLASPSSGRTWLWAKFATSTIVAGGIGLALTALNCVVFQAGLAEALLQGLVIVAGAAALCGIGVGISAALPRFVYENPAHRVSPWALILGFFATAGYVFACAAVFVATWLLGSQAPELADTVYACGAGAFVLLTAGAMFLPMALGARRLDGYQWTH